MARGPIQIPWPLSSAPGASPQESGGRLINCAAEPLGESHPSKMVWRRRAGLSSFCDTALSGFRGGILVNNNTAFVAVGGSIVQVTSGGVVTVCGALPGTDRVTFARDNESPTPQVICVSPANGAFLVTSGSVTSYNGSGSLPQPNCTWGQDSYFFFGIGDNRVFAAGPNSTTLNALTFITVQSRNTGNLLRGVPYQGLSFIFTNNFCEVWADTAQPFPNFPYSRYAVIDRGLFGRNAIAGWEDGFGDLHWVGDDCKVHGLSGTSVTDVSPPDLDRLIQAIGAANADTLQASCYIEGGKKFWALSSPAWTWELNLNTGRWNERQSWNAGLFGAWRAVGSLLAFGQWLTGDALSTKLLLVDPSTQQEVGNPLRMRMESGPVKDFPNRQTIARADFDFVTGVGQSAATTPTGQAPRVSISCSRNGGTTWDNPRIRSLGAQAAGVQRVYATRFGQSGNQGPRFRVDLSDEVYGGFMGATCSDDVRAG